MIYNSIMNITDRLMTLDPSLVIHDEGEWNMTTSTYRAFNSGGIECETGEFLYGLIRLIKPLHVLETGTHFGIGASYMGLALLDNAKDGAPGKLDTIEFLPEIHEKAKERMRILGLNNIVACHFGDAGSFIPIDRYSLILLDTEPQTRFQELVRFEPYLNEGGFVFIHDLHRHMHQIAIDGHEFAWPYGTIPEAMKTLIREGILRPFHFSTPRGLTGFYKVSPEDHKWNQ